MFGNVKRESCHLCVCVCVCVCCACNTVMWGRFAVVCNELVTAETGSFCMCLHHRSKWGTIQCTHVCITWTQLSLEITSVRVVFNSLKRNLKPMWQLLVALCTEVIVMCSQCCWFPVLFLNITKGSLGPAALSDGTQCTQWTDQTNFTMHWHYISILCSFSSWTVGFRVLNIDIAHWVRVSFRWAWLQCASLTHPSTQ
jgi:hypothetical protein